DGVVDALAADLVDGQLDGKGARGTLPRITAASILASAQVLIEAMRNELSVDARVATRAIDDVIRRLARNRSVPLSGAQALTAAMIERTAHGIDAAESLLGPGSLREIDSAVARLAPGMLPSEARKLLPRDGSAALTPALSAIAGAADDAILALIQLGREGKP